MLSSVAVNLALALVTCLFLSCVSPRFCPRHFFCSLDPCVVAVSRVLLELTVRNGSISLSSDFIDVDSVINFLCILRVRSYN